MMAARSISFQLKLEKKHKSSKDTARSKSAGIPLQFSKFNMSGNDMRVTGIRAESNGHHGIIRRALYDDDYQYVDGNNGKTSMVRLQEVIYWKLHLT